MGQVVWSPLAQGVLTGKYQPGHTPPQGSRAADGKGGSQMIGHLMKDPVLEAVAGLAPIAAELELTMGQLALAWVLGNDNVSAAIIGASRPEQVAENAAASGVRLDADVRRRIDEVLGDRIQRDPGLTRSPNRLTDLG